MKRIIIANIAFLMTLNVWSQSPNKMSYQAVIRDTADNLLVATTLGMQISILQGSPNGMPVYVETHAPTTNANGLVSLEIGTGTTLDVFSDIDWSNGAYYIKTETDTTGGNNYTITGVSQLMSVPYALYAKTAGNTEPGPQGEAGVGITSTIDNNNGTFTLNFSDGSSFTTADLTGPQGAMGVQGPVGPIGLTGQQGAQGLTGSAGSNGQDGVGISSTTDNNNGTFTLNFSDGSTQLIDLSILDDSEGVSANSLAINDLKSLSSARIYVGNASGEATAANITGAINIDNTGVTSLSDAVVTSPKLADASVTTSKLEDQSITEPKLDKTNIAISGFGAAITEVDLGSQRITNVADPTEAQDAATKNYTYSKQEVDALLAQAVAGLEEQIDNEPSLSIGQEYQGGIIFWLDQTGKHGLMMPGENYIPVELPWSNTNGDKGAKGDGLYAGKQNTTAIVAQTLSSGYTGNFAAKHCLDYEVADNDIIYGDWYLPSHYELNLLLIAGVNGLVTIPQFEGSTYYLLWSSTQRNNQFALVIDSVIPVYDNSYTESQFNGVWPVIPIRAF